MIVPKYSTFGSAEGKLVVYFHGAPGSSSECAVLDLPAKKYGLRVVCFDRFSLDGGDDRGFYYQQIASAVSEMLEGDETVDIVGFSIGAFVALEVSARLAKKVKNIHLVSAAAPLCGGDYMAAIAGDAAHCQDGKFQAFIIPILASCFKNGSSGYMRDVASYVKWDDDLKWCSAKTPNWHGDSDNWSPFEMAVYLQSIIPGAVKLERLVGMSHYSCFMHAAPRIMRQLAIK